MSGTSVLPPTTDGLDMPLLHHKPKPEPAMPTTETTMGGLHMIKERDEELFDSQDPDAVRQHYENMTYDEMSQRMAENYKQLSAMLGTTTISNLIKESATTSAGHHSDSYNAAQSIVDDDDLIDDEKAVVSRTDLDDETKRRKMTKIFCRAASSGDLEKVTQLLSQHRSLIDIDAKDEDGTTPLIYAACFGKADIAQALLAAGAKTDIQDSYGWSALMWATNNNHEEIVKMLLENGASSHTRSAKGRTVFDFLNTDNQKIVEILATNPRDSVSSTSSILGRNTAGSLSSSSSNAGDCDFYYQSTVEGYDNFMAEEADRRKKLLETAMALATDGHMSEGEEDFEEENNDDEDNEDDEEDHNEFQWDKCLPDQMFVFSADNLQYILDTVITNIQLPVRSRQEICVPANVVFLSARFAHYFSSDELLHQVLEGAMQRISTEVKTNARNVHILAFWITNVTQLLYYLKKDTGLVVATADYQLRLSELISEIYTMIVNDTERRLSKILSIAMLEHEQIPGMEDVNFADDWQRFFRRSSRRSVIVPPDGGLATQMKRNSNMLSSSSSSNNSSACMGQAISPQSITSLLTSTLYVLQSYDVHPTIIIQALAQFFHFMSCELFNRILTNKKLLCRSKALQIRMNLSQIEDWITQSRLPSSLTSYFEPTMQLLQLLQCLTQLQDLVNFIHTVKTFDALNALQVKRCVVNYRYEVNEPRLPEEVEKYAIQLAEDTVRYKQARDNNNNSSSNNNNFRRRKSSFSGSSIMSRAQSVSLRRTRSRRDSVSSFVGSLMSSVGITTSASLPPSLPSSPTEEEEGEQGKPPAQEEQSASPTTEEPVIPEKEEDEDEKDIKEIKDSKFMLPFSVPTTAHMVSITAWSPDDTKREKTKEERLVYPVIPNEWMDKLDNGLAD